MCAIGGVFLIGYSLWKFKTERKRKKIKPQQLSKKADDTIVNKIQREQKQKEIEQLDKGENSDTQRQKENEDRFTPSNIK